MRWWHTSLIARFMGATWGPPEADRTQMGPMLAPWTLLSGLFLLCLCLSWGTPVSSLKLALLCIIYKCHKHWSSKAHYILISLTQILISWQLKQGFACQKREIASKGDIFQNHHYQNIHSSKGHNTIKCWVRQVPIHLIPLSLELNECGVVMWYCAWIFMMVGCYNPE